MCAHEEDDDQKLHNYAAAALDQRRGNDHLKEETIDINNPHHIPICEHASEKSPILLTRWLEHNHILEMRKKIRT